MAAAIPHTKLNMRVWLSCARSRLIATLVLNISLDVYGEKNDILHCMHERGFKERDQSRCHCIMRLW